MSDPATGLGGLGLRFQELPIPPVLGAVSPDGPAARAGLKAGDEILSINGEPVPDFLALVALVRAHPDETIAVQYRRDGQDASTRVAVAGVTQDGVRIGRIQVTQPHVPLYPPGMLRHVRYGPFAALVEASREAWNMTVLQARMLVRMLAGEVSVKNLSGPLTIAQLAGRFGGRGRRCVPEFFGVDQPSARFYEPTAYPDTRRRSGRNAGDRMAKRQSTVRTRVCRWATARDRDGGAAAGPGPV